MKNNICKLTCVIIMTTLLTLSGCSSRHSQETPFAMVQYAIHLMETEQYEEFVKKLAHPSIVKKRGHKRLVEVFTRIAKREGKKKINALKGIKKKTMIRKSDTVVQFPMKGGPYLTLGKDGDKWYILR